MKPSSLKITNYQLLLVEDNPSLQESLTQALLQHGYGICNASSGKAMMQALERGSSIDLIILESGLPDQNALYWLRWLKHYYASIPVLILSETLCEEQRWLKLEQGARDYILKPFHYKELLLRVENILKPRVVQTSSVILDWGAIKINTQRQYAEKGIEFIKLTQIEVAILKMLDAHLGQVVSRDMFMQQLRGQHHHPLDRSIDIHINSLRKKLEDNPKCPHYIYTVRGKGYKLALAESAV